MSAGHFTVNGWPLSANNFTTGYGVELLANATTTSCFQMPTIYRNPGLGDGRSPRIVETINCASNGNDCRVGYKVAYGCAPLPTYSWVTSAWSACSSSGSPAKCDIQGIQTRTVTCTASDPSQLEPRDCYTTLPAAPPVSQLCPAIPCSAGGTSTAGSIASGSGVQSHVELIPMLLMAAVGSLAIPLGY